MAESNNTYHKSEYGSKTKKERNENKNVTHRIDSNSSVKIRPKSVVKIYAALPENQNKSTVKHIIYSKTKVLMAECTSAYKQDCIINIESGKYSVKSIFMGNTHITKLHVLENQNAYLYTSFKQKNQSGANSRTDIVENTKIDAEIEAIYQKEANPIPAPTKTTKKDMAAQEAMQREMMNNEMMEREIERDIMEREMMERETRGGKRSQRGRPRERKGSVVSPDGIPLP
ncbi:MAG: hypothetical protein HF962_05795 [Sulfurovum sp.]|nr:hypothetical protein [Sulfurovum sp.]